MQTSKYTTLAWYPILAVGLSMVSFIMIKTGRDGVFFQDGGLRQLPMAYIWIAVVAVPAAILHLYALERWGARRTRTVLFGLTAGLFLAFAPFVHPAYRIMMTILFILVPTFFAAVFAAAWLLASDLLEGAAPDLLRQVYTRIGAASMLGGIVGGVLSKAITTYLEPPYLLVSGALVLLVAGLVVARAHRHNPIQHLSLARPNEPEPAPATRFADSSSVLIKHTYVRVLIGISVVASIAALYIDFQFYATATLSGRNNPQFFANFYIMLNTLSLAIQLFVAPRLQAKLGLSGALLLLPAALLGSSGVFAVLTIVHSRTILRMIEGGLKASIHRSMWEQVYLLIARPYRDMAKTVVDGAFQRLAEGLGSLVLVLWFATSHKPVEQLNFSWILWVIMAAMVLWLGLTRYLSHLGCSNLTPTEVYIRLPDG